MDDSKDCIGWQTDEFGRRFRMIGGIRDFESTIRIDGIEVPESQLEAFHKARAEDKKKELDRARKKTISAPVRLCPFKRAKNALNLNCVSDCSFYDGGCSLSRSAATRETAGLFCPICNKCFEQCAIYNHGCTMIHILKR